MALCQGISSNEINHKHLSCVCGFIWMGSDRNRTVQDYLNTAYFPKCSWSYWKLLENTTSFSVVDGPRERQPLWSQLPLIYSDSGSVISVVLLGRRWKDSEHSFHFFPPSWSKSSPTPRISYWTWPTGQVAIPHFQRAGGGWVAPLAAHAGSSTPLLAPRGFLQSDSSCSGLSDDSVCHFCHSVAHTHTHSSCQWPRGPGILFSVSSVLLHTAWLHCSRLHCRLLPAIGSDLFLSLLNILPWSANGTQTFALFPGVSPLLSNYLFKVHLVSVAWYFFFVWFLFFVCLVFYGGGCF